MISQNTIAKVFETSRVEEVIGDFIQLKKSGSNFKGLSPFSDEKTPSFMVSPVKQIWKDFSSGKGGNSVSFLMEHEHFSYPEAIKYLAKKYNIEVEETEQTDEQKEQANERESLYLISEYAKKFFHNSLLKTEEGKAIGLTYFKERGFTLETINTFELGYSPDVWDAFTNRAIKEEYQLKYLEKTGLTIVNGEKTFDRFKGRVMFPILSMSGRTLGFGGRILSSDKKTAKYLNSPESDIYHKSKVLYGIFQAKNTIAKEDNCYLVEGYTDVIQLYQKGVTNVVSSSGTALTPDQIRLISRLTKNITVLFDGDEAGLRASLRGVDLILEQGMNVKICTFPKGEDPDSFAKNNSLEDIQLYLKEQQQDFISFKASLLAIEAEGDPIKKGQTVREIVLSISKIPNAIMQEIYIKECSRIMDVSEENLYNELAQLLQKQSKTVSRKNVKPLQQPFHVLASKKEEKTSIDVQFELERKIIELLLLYGSSEEDFEELILETDEEGQIIYKSEHVKSKVFEKIFLDLQEDEIEFTNAEFKELYSQIITDYNQKQEFKIDAFINQLPAEKSEAITHILMEEEKHILHDWEGKQIYVKDKNQTVAQLVNETILNLRRHLVTLKIKDLANDIKDMRDEDRKKEIMIETIDYSTLKKILSERLNRVI